MKIVMLGTGYVGLVSGACFSDFGFDVTCLDKDKLKIKNLKNGVMPIFEPGLENLVKKSDIILWNGPMGMIEDHKFSKGSINLSHLLAKAQANVVIGGGDTILAINMAKEKFEDFYFVSTAGGAFLEALEDKELLGIEALKAD